MTFAHYCVRNVKLPDNLLTEGFEFLISLVEGAWASEVAAQGLNSAVSGL